MICTNFSFSPAEVLIQSGEQYIDFLVEEIPFADSAVFWIKATENNVYNVLIPFRDTAFNAKVTSKKIVDSKSKVSNNLIKDELAIRDTLTLMFDFPIVNFNESFFSITQAGVLINGVSFVVDGLRNIKILGDFNSDFVYQVAVLPNAIQFYDDTYYTDSIQVSFKKLGANKYANLELVLEEKPNVPMLIQLLNNGKVIAEKSVSLDQVNVSFELLPPGEYMVKVVLDANENGKWDTGSWILKQQAEKVIWFRQSFTLRANWDTKQPLGFQ